MNLLNTLKTIVNYYETSRQVGHTTAMLNGALNSDCFVLVENYNSKRQFESQDIKNVVNINNLTELEGCHKPLLIDNCTIYLLLSQVVSKMEKINVIIND